MIVLARACSKYARVAFCLAQVTRSKHVIAFFFERARSDNVRADMKNGSAPKHKSSDSQKLIICVFNEPASSENVCVDVRTIPFSSISERRPVLKYS